MATFIQTGKNWQAQVFTRLDGVDHRKAKTFRLKRDAQIWANEYETEMRQGVSSSDNTLGQVFDRYMRERSKAKKGEKWELIRLERFKRDPVEGQPLGCIKIGEVTTAQLVAWRDARLSVVKPASVRREMNLLKHVFTTATDDWGLIGKNPMMKVSRPPAGKRRSRRISNTEIEQISAALDLSKDQWISEKQITGAAFLFAIETAMRSGEILGIKNRHVTGNVVHLPETKSDHARDVPLTHRAAEILGKIRNGRDGFDEHPFDLDAVSRDSRFRAAVRKVDIGDLHFHDTRHEAITRLAKRLQVLDLARVTGHKDINELLTYYEASGEDLAERLNSSTSSEDIK